MDAHVLPDNFVAELKQLGSATPLCDAAGNVIGTFIPSEYEADEPDLSREELERIKNSSEWYSTAEVLRRLESLE